MASFSPPSCIDGYIATLKPTVGGFFELLANIFDRDDRRIAGRMDIGCFENQFLLRIGGSAAQCGHGSYDRGCH